MIAELDLADLAFWSAPPEQRRDAFARLREQPRPVYFVEPRTPFARSGRGFHALVRHADVVEASKNTAVFASAPSVMSPDAPRWLRHLVGESMVNLDDERHARLRKLVSRAFAPKVIAKLDQMISSAVRELVDEVVCRGEGDFVALVAARLPIRVICEMLGIPPAGRAEIARHVELVSTYTGVRADLMRALPLAGRNLHSLVRLQRMVVRLARERRANPGGDLLSMLATADVDGERLSAKDLGAFFTLLLVAGDTTMQAAISWALVLLTDHPGQRELLASDFNRHIDGAIDETLRFATPIQQFRRTARTPVRIGGVAIEPGERVALFFGSANRDPLVFTDPDRFRIERDPNPHVSFGGGGPHYCLGARLARRQLTLLYRELLGRAPGIRAVGTPRLLRSNFDNVISSVRFAAGPATTPR